MLPKTNIIDVEVNVFIAYNYEVFYGATCKASRYSFHRKMVVVEFEMFVAKGEFLKCSL